MQVNHPFRPGLLVQAVDILRDQREASAMTLLQLGESQVRGIWLHPGELAPARVVEAVHQRRVPREGFRRGHLLHPVAPGFQQRGGERLVIGDGHAAGGGDLRAR